MAIDSSTCLFPVCSITFTGWASGALSKELLFSGPSSLSATGCAPAALLSIYSILDFSSFGNYFATLATPSIKSFLLNSLPNLLSAPYKVEAILSAVVYSLSFWILTASEVPKNNAKIRALFYIFIFYFIIFKVKN